MCGWGLQSRPQVVAEIPVLGRNVELVLLPQVMFERVQQRVNTLAHQVAPDEEQSARATRFPRGPQRPPVEIEAGVHDGDPMATVFGQCGRRELSFFLDGVSGTAYLIAVLARWFGGPSAPWPTPPRRCPPRCAALAASSPTC